MKILLRGQVSDRTLEGRYLLGMARAMTAAGVQVRLATGIVDPPIPARLAQLLTKETFDRYDLMVSTTPEPAFETATTKLLLTSELLTPSSPWLPGANSVGWDAVLYQDPGSLATIRAYGEPTLALVPFVPGITVEDFPWQERDWWGPLSIVVSRDEQEVAKKAYDILAKDPTIATHPKLAVVDLKSLRTAQLAGVTKDFNVLVCGSGRPNTHQEFMASGAVVVADYAGVHERWLNNDFSYRYIHSSDNLASVLRDLVLNPEQAFRKADNARRMAQFTDWSVVLDKLFLNLEDVVEGGVSLRDNWLRLQPPADSQGSRS